VQRYPQRLQADSFLLMALVFMRLLLTLPVRRFALRATGLSLGRGAHRATRVSAFLFARTASGGYGGLSANHGRHLTSEKDGA
jgi:hypothetical protein